jgi:hypothetical protein
MLLITIVRDLLTGFFVEFKFDVARAHNLDLFAYRDVKELEACCQGDTDELEISQNNLKKRLYL